MGDDALPRLLPQITHGKRFFIPVFCLVLAGLLTVAVIMESMTTFYVCNNLCMQGSSCPPCIAPPPTININVWNPAILIQLIVIIALILSAIVMFL